MLSRALVIAMVGRMSMPSAISSREILADPVAPRIERDDACRARTIADAGRCRRRDGCCAGPGRAIGFSARDEMASAR